MKVLITILAMALFSVAVKGQNTEYDIVLPEFADAKCASIQDYLKKNVQYPVESYNCGKQGTEVIQFIVTETGKIKNISVYNSVCPEVDEEVIRILKTTDEKWKPGTVNGQRVSMSHEVSLTFLLHPTMDLVKMAQVYQRKGSKWLFVKNRPRKALLYYNKGIILMPYNESLLAMRGLCKFELGDREGAFEDWNRIKTTAQNHNSLPELENLEQKYGVIRGYSEMMKVLADNHTFYYQLTHLK